MKRNKTKAKRLNKRKTKKQGRPRRRRKNKHEEFFVSNFLGQPGKTRSGMRYTKKTKGILSHESIFGSLLTDNVMENITKKGLYNAKDKCSCKQCIEKQKGEEARTCRSSHSGMNLLLKNESKSQCPNGNIVPSSSSNECKNDLYKRPSQTCSDISLDKKIRFIISAPKRVKKAPKPKPRKYKKKKKKRGKKTKYVRHTKRSKSLLKYVLEKKSKANLESSAGTSNNKKGCTCCNRFLEVLKKNPSKLKVQSAESVIKLWNTAVCDKAKSNSAMPYVSAGVQQQETVLFPSAGTPMKQRPKKKIFANKKKKHNKKKGPPKEKTTAKKWKSLSLDMIKRLKRKRSQQSQKSTSSSSTVKKESPNIAPIPSSGNTCYWDLDKCSDTKTRRKKEKWTKESTEESSSQPSEKITKFPGAPVPSGRVPTFIAMVKTAIRDLKPFHITGQQAISKYIQIRYRIRNDELLAYVLKWMVEMKILKYKRGNYYFIGARIVKQRTVTKVRRTSKKRKPKRKSKKRKRSKRKTKGRKRGCTNKKCTCSAEMKAVKNRIKYKSKYVRRNGRIYKEDEYI